MNQRGMAMIELLCVITILSILATQAMPKLNLLDNLRLEYETANFVSDLRWMQQSVMSRYWSDSRFIAANPNPEVLMRFTEDSYSIDSNIILREHHFYKGIRLMAPVRSIIFAMDGQLSLPVTIWICSDKEVRLVIIDRVGRIRVQKK